MAKLTFEEKKPLSKLAHVTAETPVDALAIQFHREMRESDDNAGTSAAEAGVSAAETVYHAERSAQYSRKMKESRNSVRETAEVDLDSFFDDLYSVFGGTSALTPVGNMTLVDDILQDESNTSVHKLENEQKSKQFITIQTKNGNYFYLIIDRSGDTENVYFLNMVDESDLLALMADGTEEETEKPEPVCVCEKKCIAGEVNTDCEVCVLTMKKCGGKEIVVAEPLPEPEEPKNSSGILLIVLLLAAGGGAVYFLKFRKNKPDTSGTTDLDDYDYGEEDEEIEYESETEDND